MTTSLEETQVSYEDLADIEKDFEEVEVEIIRQQLKLTAPLYAQREKAISKIPNFWPLVLEQAPPDIDQYIQPSDSALLLSSLTSLSVSHIDTALDPRSVSIRWEFSENDHFDDAVLEKKFWYRKKETGFAGLVSEPVEIRWKSKEKDLTGGLLRLALEAWEEEKKLTAVNGSSDEKKKQEGLGEKQKALKKRIESTSMGGVSFFAWFGYIGQRVTAEEDRKARAAEKESREKRKSERNSEEQSVQTLAEGDDDDDEDDPSYDLEIFPDGDELALAITDDLWPGAIKYFTQAQEQDALSDADFESLDEENIPDLDPVEMSGDEDSDAGDLPPSKRHKPS